MFINFVISVKIRGSSLVQITLKMHPPCWAVMTHSQGWLRKCTRFGSRSVNKAGSLCEAPAAMLSSSALIHGQSTWLHLVENTDISFLAIVALGSAAADIRLHSWASDVTQSHLWPFHQEDVCLPHSLLCADDVFFEPPKVVVPSILRRFPAASLSEMTSSGTRRFVSSPPCYTP